MRKGLYDGNNRKEWLSITEAESSSFKLKLNEAQAAAATVMKQLESSLKEFSDI